MKRPSGLTLVLGHPIIGGSMMLACLGGLYVAWQTTNPVVFVVALVALGKLGAAFDAAGKYRAWRKSWEAMDADAPRRRAKRRAQLGSALIGLGLIAAYLFGDPESLTRYGRLSLVGVAGLAVVWIGRRALGSLRRRSRRTRRDPPVAIVARPMLPVPPHCRAILGQRP